MTLRPLLLASSAAIALAASLALAGPATALGADFDGGIELAQATPPAATPPATPPAAGERGRPMRAFSPQDMCKDRVARRIGDRAYLKAKLDLKAEQMAAWNNFEKAADEASVKATAYCATLPTEMKDRPSYVQRLTMEENAMKARISTIEAVKPSLAALYDVLNPEQKAALDRAGGPGFHRMGGHPMPPPGPGPR